MDEEKRMAFLFDIKKESKEKWNERMDQEFTTNNEKKMKA